MSDYEVESGVEVPPKLAGKCKYPWNDMEPGDSFWVPCREDETPHDAQRRMTSVASKAAKVRGLSYTTHQEGDGVRVWLLEKDHD